ncbi:MAG TPA: alpha/beta hydrolase-fold protein [Pyrinomonadaceae bacterium]|nr:alpha/beta hydrolase-fold protein [Pyrinomonadaceae bacterium]
MRNGILSVILGGLLTTTAAAAGSAEAQQGEGLLNRTVNVGATSYTYQVYVPAHLRGKQNLPVILFLHGIGQRGTGGFLSTDGVKGAMLRHYLEKVPAIILLPQCRRGSYWSDPVMDQMVTASLAQTVAEFKADPSRLYLTGVSMGGYGAWHLASEHPNMFAAIVSICGGSPLYEGERFNKIARRVGKTPVWVFHGSDDRVVPVTESRQMVEALKANKGNVRYNEYEGVGHNVWLKVLAERELLPWMLKQQLSITS